MVERPPDDLGPRIPRAKVGQSPAPDEKVRKLVCLGTAHVRALQVNKYPAAAFPSIVSARMAFQQIGKTATPREPRNLRRTAIIVLRQSFQARSKRCRCQNHRFELRDTIKKKPLFPAALVSMTHA
jgi:hypothetical protein